MGCNGSKNMKRSRGLRVDGDPELFMEADQNVADDPGEDAGIIGRARDGLPSLQAGDLGSGPDKTNERKMADDVIEEVEYLAKPSLSVPSYLLYQDTEEIQTEELTIVNEESVPVFFKIKITHPRLFVVKPIRGQIAARSPVTLQVTLKPSADEINFKTPQKKMKLMVQGLNVHYTESQVLPQSLWMSAPSKSLSVNVVKIQFVEPVTEEVDFSKFRSVNADDLERRWWDRE